MNISVRNISFLFLVFFFASLSFSLCIPSLFLFSPSFLSNVHSFRFPFFLSVFFCLFRSILTFFLLCYFCLSLYIACSLHPFLFLSIYLFASYVFLFFSLCSFPSLVLNTRDGLDIENGGKTPHLGNFVFFCYSWYSAMKPLAQREGGSLTCVYRTEPISILQFSIHRHHKAYANTWGELFLMS